MLVQDNQRHLRPYRGTSPAPRHLAWILLALGSVGCTGREEIRVFDIPKQAAPNRAVDAGSPHETAAQMPARMVAAIVRGGTQVWFFKMLGRPDQVSGAIDNFRALLQSLTLNERQEPAWKLPEGWTEQTGSGMRLATLRAGPAADSPTVSVVGLAPPQDTLDNVNRWRDQLQQAPWDAAQLAASIEAVPAGELQVELFDISGTANLADPMVGPFASASGLPNPHATMALPSAGNSTDSAGFTYDLPDGWTQQAASGMRRAYFSVADGDKTADITVITLSVSGILENVNRWRGELQLDPIAESDLDQHSAAMTIGGNRGTWINRIESQAEPRRATIAAMAEQNGQMWFFKITGSADLVAREEQNFRSLVESVTFGP